MMSLIKIHKIIVLRAIQIQTTSRGRKPEITLLIA